MTNLHLFSLQSITEMFLFALSVQVLLAYFIQKVDGCKKKLYSCSLPNVQNLFHLHHIMIDSSTSTLNMLLENCNSFS